MRTTQILMDEHRVIEQVLACLERIADDAETLGRLDLESATQAIDFLRTFADKCHHMKEEERLFPAMERCGLPREAGPTAVMRSEHEMGRGHVRRMADAAIAVERGVAVAAREFTFEARAFVELLREHIAKEDEVLFPMADRMLPAAVQDELLRGFDDAEKHEMGEGTHEKYVAIADRLAERWGVTRETARAKAHSCPCAHGH